MRKTKDPSPSDLFRVLWEIWPRRQRTKKDLCKKIFLKLYKSGDAIKVKNEAIEHLRQTEEPMDLFSFLKNLERETDNARTD